MATSSKQYYKLMKPWLIEAKDWLDGIGAGDCGLYDVVIFRPVKRAVKLFKPDTTIEDEELRELVNVDHPIDFMKLVIKTDDDITMYSHTADLPGAPLMDGRSTVFGLYAEGCKYMPEGWVVPKEHELNDTYEPILVGRQTTGLIVCDWVDRESFRTIRSSYWKPKVWYGLPEKSPLDEDEWMWTMPNKIEELPDSMVYCMSLVVAVGAGVYTVTGKGKNSNGVIVTPVLMLYNQIVKMLEIAEGK